MDFKFILPENRIFYLDQLRVLAIVMVIMVHVSTLFFNDIGSFNGFLASMARTISHAIGVPLFFMVSGVLLLGRDYKITEFIKKRFTRVLIPFIFWMVLFIVAVLIVKDPAQPLELAKQIILADGVGKYFWFIYALLGCYLVIPIVNPFIEKYKLKGVEYFLILYIITTICVSLSLNFNHLIKYFLPPFGFLVLGYYLHNKEFSLSRERLCLIGLIMAIVPLVYSIYSIYSQSLIADSFLQYDYYHIFNVIIVSGIFIFFKNFSLSENKIISKIYLFFKDSLLGRLTLSASICSFGIYLVHMFLVNGIKSLDLSLSSKWIPIIVVVIFLFSWLGIWVMSKIPVLKEFSGVK